MSETFVHCRDCGRKLYSIEHVSKDKQSECPYCKSINKFYVTHGSPVGHSVGTHTAVLMQNKENADT